MATRIIFIVSVGMDLLLCAIDARSGQTWFGPKLSYALPVAELIDLTMAGPSLFAETPW